MNIPDYLDRLINQTEGKTASEILLIQEAVYLKGAIETIGRYHGALCTASADEFPKVRKNAISYMKMLLNERKYQSPDSAIQLRRDTGYNSLSEILSSVIGELNSISPETNIDDKVEISLNAVVKFADAYAAYRKTYMPYQK